MKSTIVKQLEEKYKIIPNKQQQQLKKATKIKTLLSKKW